jgi:hypothetical protein
MDQPQLPLDGLDLKRCIDCGELKPVSEYHRNRGRPDGLQRRCKTCNIEVNKRWYEEHPEVKARRMYEYARARKREAQWRILDYLRAHPCVDYGESDPVVLDFDHLRDKVRNISAMMRQRWQAIVAEIEKCEVVCANCHRRRTAMRANAFRYRERDAPALFRFDDDEWGRWGSNPRTSL